jgi:hypothetical protein
VACAGAPGATLSDLRPIFSNAADDNNTNNYNNNGNNGTGGVAGEDSNVVQGRAEGGVGRRRGGVGVASARFVGLVTPSEGASVITVRL